MNFVHVAIAVGAAALTLGNIPTSQAQTPTFPPEGYSPLLFDAGDTKHVFRLSGIPWICRSDTFCKPVRVEGVADKDLANATIEPLGFAGARYFLTYKQANFEKGKETSLSCVEERCSKLDAVAGDMSSLGTYQIKQGDQMQTRLALLRKLEGRNGRTQLLWCTETGCAELPLTRDAEHHLALLGTGRSEGRTVAWLRDKSGSVLSCAQPEEGVSDQLACGQSRIVLGDFPSAASPPMTTATPAPATSDADRAALSGSIDRALVAGDLLSADRLLAEAMRRYPGHATWPALQQQLVRAHTDRETRLRQAEARRLILEARRFANVGDFVHAEQMLQEADKQAPGFAETPQARAEIAAMRTEHGQRYRERYQYHAAIDQAFAAERLWEAERLLAEYAQRFNQDDEHRGRSARLAQLRAAGPYQARVNEARAHVAKARQAMDRNDFVLAERELALADRTAAGHPEIAQARADLSRRRITAENQHSDMRLLLAAIDMALQRKQYEDADRSIDEGRRRFGSYAGWADLQTRAASARRGDDRQFNELRTQNARALELVAAARRQTAQGDLIAADKSLTEAQRISPNLPEVAIARAELERAKADHARQAAEIRAIAASVDAAIARKQYADAERLIADGSKRYPGSGWGDLSRRLAEARRASPNQTGNAPAPAQPAPAQAAPTAPAPARPAPAPPAPAQAAPAQAAPAPVPRAPATNTTPPAPPAAAPAAQASVAQLVATARAAIKRSDLAAAEKAVADAEKIDAKAAPVVAVRAELKVAQEEAPDRREGRPRERAPGGGPPTRN
jgi:hypothetical protein